MHHKAYPKWIIISFFSIGILSAIGFRALIFFTHFSEELFRPVWYCSVFGYILFFGWRFHISKRRRAALHHNNLYDKIINDEELDEIDKGELKYVVRSIEKSKELYNYMAIFALSIIAVLCDIILSM